MTAIRLATSRAWLIVRVPLLLAAALFVGHQAGDWHWPHKLRTIEVEPGIVHPGGTVGVTTVRDYFDDCTLFFGRQLESVAHPGSKPVLLPEEAGPTPWEDNGKPRTIWLQVPASFPCGAAQLRTSPAAACNLFQLWVLRQHQPDRLTPFDVACSAASR